MLYTFAEANDACDPSWGRSLALAAYFTALLARVGPMEAGHFTNCSRRPLPGRRGPRACCTVSALPVSILAHPQARSSPGRVARYYFLTGGYSDGALVQMRPPAEPGGVWTATLLYSFTEDDGWRGLAAGPHGVLYGTAPYGGTAPGQLGEVFQLTPPAAAGGAWTETVIHNFGYGGAYAGNPNSLTVASDGTIYGTTYGYDLIGDRGMGSVFELTPPASPDGRWSYRVLQDFGGYHPSPGLILRDGNLYGAVATALQAGNIFEMQPPSTPGDAWTTTYLHQFTDLVPYVDLMDKNGALYGVALTETGEPSLHTIFQLANEVGMETSAILAFITSIGACLPASPATGQTRFATLYSFTGGSPNGLTAANGVLTVGVRRKLVPASLLHAAFESHRPARCLGAADPLPG